MSIQKPDPKFSKNDLRLLSLLVGLLQDQSTGAQKVANLSENLIALSDEEARELTTLLETLLGNREFLEATHFVEGLTDRRGYNERELRTLFLDARKRKGRSKALASANWSDFQARIGIQINVGWGVRARKMTFEQFLELERKLFLRLGFHPSVAELLLQLLVRQNNAVESIRNSETDLKRGSIKRVVAALIAQLRERSGLPDLRIPTTRVAGLATFVSNMSVLFTTRDWSTAGTMSTIAGALIMSSTST